MRVVENGLTERIYTNLRNEVNFVKYEPTDIEFALKNTLYSVVVFDDDIPVGCGRIIGDDKIAFLIKDVVVKKTHQGKGIGKLVMNSLLNYISKHATYNAYIGLMSTPNKEDFYEKFGFIRRPNKDYGAGMIMYYKGEKK